MKLLLLILLSFCLVSCQKGEEKEDFTPYPGGKCCEEEPKS